MGRAKDRLIQDYERGYTLPDGNVCADCFNDEYLKEFIADNATAKHCDYCGEESENNIAAPF